MGAWTFPVLSTRNSILPALISRTARPRRRSPFRPWGGHQAAGTEDPAQLTHLPMTSGVATTTSKSSQPSLIFWTNSRPT
jgi:hypothetical protein